MKTDRRWLITALVFFYFISLKKDLVFLINMIQEIIFDVGAVLIKLNFQRMYEALAEYIPEKDPKIIEKRYGESGLEKLYNSVMSSKEYFKGIREKVLFRKDVSDEILDDIRSLALGEPIWEMVELKKKLEKLGYDIGILSTHTENAYNFIKRKCPEILHATTQAHFSHITKIMKPDLRAYLPFGEDKIFIDDKISYLIPPVEKLKWKGIWYTQFIDPKEAIRGIKGHDDKKYSHPNIKKANSYQEVISALQSFGIKT